MNYPRSRPFLVLLVSGCAGFALGMFRFPSWQVAVETSQVLAGLVKYPQGNPFYIYHTKLWTVIHQVCAALLMNGVSEVTLSKLLSGVLGMLSLQALSLFIYALSGEALMAVVASVAIFLSGAAEYWTAYPVSLMGTSDTYSSLGLSSVVLIVALLGAGCYRTGGFLLGLMPAIHPTLGAWLWLTTAICAGWDAEGRREVKRTGLPFFLAGACATAVSLGIQLAFIYDVPRVDTAAATRYFYLFVKFWDAHRQPVAFFKRAVILNIGAAVLALAWLTGFRHTLSRSTAIMLRFVVVYGALGIASVLLSWISPDRLPAFLLILMPTRMLNFNVMVVVALMLGLTSAYRAPASSTAITALLLLAMLAAGHDVVRSRVGRRSAPPDFRNQANDPFFAAVGAEHRGMLLTGGTLHLIQLSTRRAVLLDGGGLDALPYAKEAGPEMARILRDAYSIDLVNPPAGGPQGSIDDDVNKVAWEHYSRDRWREIAERYNITQVLTHADWTLDLPLAAQNGQLRLYTTATR